MIPVILTIVAIVGIAAVFVATYRLNAHTAFPDTVPLPRDPDPKATNSEFKVTCPSMGNRYVPHIFIGVLVSLGCLTVLLCLALKLTPLVPDGTLYWSAIALSIVIGLIAAIMTRGAIRERAIENTEAGGSLYANAEFLEFGRGLTAFSDHVLFKPSESATFRYKWADISRFAVEPWRRMAPACYEIDVDGGSKRLFVWRKYVGNREQQFINVIAKHLKCPLIIDRSI